MIGATSSGILGLFLLDEKNPLKGWSQMFLIQFICSILALIATSLFAILSCFGSKKKEKSNQIPENYETEIRDTTQTPPQIEVIEIPESQEFETEIKEKMIEEIFQNSEDTKEVIE